MNVWKLVQAGHLERSELPTPVNDSEELIRVRVKKVFLNNVDAALYHGRIKAKYPLIPGRFAVGNVSDETKHLLFPKGTRVLLHTFRPAPDTGTMKLSFDEDDYEVCGQTTDGYLSEFVLVPPSAMTPLPDRVSDEGALLAHLVALSRTCIDKLGVRRGQHVAVVGANLLGILVCRLLIYQQAAPILIDADPSNLEFAKKCGVYYALPVDAELMENIGNITGGRLVSGAVFVTSAVGNDRSLPFRICARGASVAMCGMAPTNLEFDLEPALKKQISIHCVWNCASQLESAINLLATHAVETANFEPVILDENMLEDFFENYRDEAEMSVKELHIVNMV